MSETDQKTEKKERNDKTIAAACVCFVIGMVGMSYAAVPLYELFCRVTGYGGTTQVADAAPAEVLDREITIRFDANVAGGLNWKFKPQERRVTIKVGEIAEVNYEIASLMKDFSAGTSSFNVSPPSAGAYFNKMECFCFTEQVLKPGETQKMPVVFFVDPEFVNDHDANRISTITLSYTFFPTDLDEEQLANLRQQAQTEIN